MNIERQLVFAGVLVAVLAAAIPAMAASAPNSTGVPAQMVITVQPSAHGSGVPASLQAPDVVVQQAKTTLPVTLLQRMAGDLANMQLFVFLDDSTRSASLGTHLPELKTFLNSLPATAEVAVGYMRNGTVALAQAFTADHQKAANALRLPEAIPGENGSPYFALSDLVKHWPSSQSTGRRVALILTDGVDRYYDTATVDDPYVDAAVQDALKNGVAVYSIYLRGAGLYGQSGRGRNFAQSRLLQVTEQTGGYAYFEAFTDPVEIAPFLTDFLNRLDNQYKVTFQALNTHGVQPVKLRSELPGVKIEGPTRIYVQ
jgi:hypothetical protein